MNDLFKNYRRIYSSVNPISELSEKLDVSQKFRNKIFPFDTFNYNRLTQNSNIHSKLFNATQLMNAYRFGELLGEDDDDLAYCLFDLESPEQSKDEKEIKEKDRVRNNVIKLITDIYNEKQLIDKIHSREYEKIVAEILFKKGFKVELTGETRDGGLDIIALKKISGIQFKMLVECKKRKDTIGVNLIREFCDVVNTNRANKGLFVTTSYFSPESLKRAKHSLIDLVNRDEFLKWVDEYINPKDNLTKSGLIY